MGTIRIFVLADGTTLDGEAWETEHLLLKDTEVFVVDLAHEQLLGEPRIAWILIAVLDVVHAFDEIVLCDTQGLTKVQSVEVSLLFVHHDHDIVSRLVIDQQLTIAVADDTT